MSRKCMSMHEFISLLPDQLLGPEQRPLAEKFATTYFQLIADVDMQPKQRTRVVARKVMSAARHGSALAVSKQTDSAPAITVAPISQTGKDALEGAAALSHGVHDALTRPNAEKFKVDWNLWNDTAMVDPRIVPFRSFTRKDAEMLHRLDYPRRDYVLYTFADPDLQTERRKQVLRDEMEKFAKQTRAHSALQKRLMHVKDDPTLASRVATPACGTRPMTPATGLENSSNVTDAHVLGKHWTSSKESRVVRPLSPPSLVSSNQVPEPAKLKSGKPSSFQEYISLKRAQGVEVAASDRSPTKVPPGLRSPTRERKQEGTASSGARSNKETLNALLDGSAMSWVTTSISPTMLGVRGKRSELT